MGYIAKVPNVELVGTNRTVESYGLVCTHSNTTLTFLTCRLSMISDCNCPDSFGLFDQLNLHFEELTDDFEVRRRVTGQWSGAKPSSARERHRNEQLVSYVPAYWHTRRDIGTCLLNHSGCDTFGTHVDFAKSGEHFSAILGLNLDGDGISRA